MLQNTAFYGTEWKSFNMQVYRRFHTYSELCGNTKLDKIRNVHVQQKGQVIKDKMRESRLRKFNHVLR